MQKKSVIIRKLLILPIILVFWGCSKSSPEDNPVVVEGDVSFSMEIKNADVSNFRVGNEINVDVTELTDATGGSDFVYMLKPVGNDATRHQVLGVDYALKLKEGDAFTDVSIVEIIDVKDLPKLKIIPKVPGTFQIDFELQKYDRATKRYVGSPQKKQLVFSVVKINFYFPTQQVRKAGTFNHSVHRRAFKFSIDDGNREYDSYLSNYASSKRYEYITHYDGQTKSGEFSVEGQFDFRDGVETIKGPVPMNEVPQHVTIEVTQYLNNGLKNIIKYQNVQLEY